MKDLYLIRHAKSDWDDITLSDFDRPLNKRGRNNAPFMAQNLKQRIQRVDMIVSSPANRAISTANYFAHAFDLSEESISKDKRIYEAPVSSLLEVLNSFDNRWQTVLMFGHNPGFSYLTNYLTGEACQMPTCSIAHIRFDLNDWKHISNGTGRLIDLDYPKRYAQNDLS